MKFFFTILAILVILGCDRGFEKVGLDKELYNTILEYQKKYPIPKTLQKQTKSIYVYNVYFWFQNHDTILVLQRSSAGILSSTKGYGIYEDKKLKPTFIRDEKNLGNKFILKKISNVSNEKYFWNEGRSSSENFPPVHKYSIKNKKITLIKIDTIWKHWD